MGNLKLFNPSLPGLSFTYALGIFLYFKCVFITFIFMQYWSLLPHFCFIYKPFFFSGQRHCTEPVVWWIRPCPLLTPVEPCYELGEITLIMWRHSWMPRKRERVMIWMKCNKSFQFPIIRFGLLETREGNNRNQIIK